MPKNDERFPQIQSGLSDSVTPAILHFCLSVIQELESFLVFFQVERLHVFFFLFFFCL